MKSEQGRLLDEMQNVTGLHRKSLLRLIDSELARKPLCKQRGKGCPIGLKNLHEVPCKGPDFAPSLETLDSAPEMVCVHIN